MLEQGAALREMEHRLADARRERIGRATTTLLETYGHAQTEFEVAGGYDYETRIRQVLGGLGFNEDEHDKQLAHLSGGERTRALLAQLLLQRPDLLLLDEPTNHLDLEAVEWLEEMLLRWPGGLVVVAHDRYFLDKVANRIWDMNFGRLEAYRGNYSSFRTQKEMRLDRQRQEWESQQEFVEKTEEFIRRNLAGQRTKEAQGRRTRLERFLRDEAHRPAAGPAAGAAGADDANPLGRPGAGDQGPGGRLRPAAVLRGGCGNPPGRPRRADRAERRRQDDAAQDRPRPDSAPAGQGALRRERRGGLPGAGAGRAGPGRNGARLDPRRAQPAADAGAQLPGAVPVPGRRRLPHDRHVERRAAEPGGARAADPAGRELPAAGRADEPSGPGHAGNPGAGAEAIPRHDPARDARPVDGAVAGDAGVAGRRRRDARRTRGTTRSI